MLLQKLQKLVDGLNTIDIPTERRSVLDELANYIKSKKDTNETINLNFICTHNSRRSHLSQIWAQVMASYFNIDNVNCYSGGTESTAMYPAVGKILKTQGFNFIGLSDGVNPIYAIKYSKKQQPIIAFSKTFDHEFNPKSNFAAIMTCSHADENCPFIIGAEKRIPVRYEDPKVFDNTPIQLEKYEERSLQIATEMKYVFSKIS